MFMILSWFFVHWYSPSNDFVNDENIKSIVWRWAAFLVHNGTPLPHEVDISVWLRSNQDGLLPPSLHFLHVIIKEEPTGLYTVVVVVVRSWPSTEISMLRPLEHSCASAISKTTSTVKQ